MTALAVRQWRDRQVADLNASRTVATAASAQPGQVIPAAPEPPAPTAAEIAKAAWMAKFQRLKHLDAITIPSSQMLTDREALRADVVATYLSSYL